MEPRVSLRVGLIIGKMAIRSTVRLAVSCTCWIAADSFAYNLVPSRIILVVGWLVMQTAKEDAGLVAVDCVLLRGSILSGSWIDQTVVLAVGLMAGWVVVRMGKRPSA